MNSGILNWTAAISLLAGMATVVGVFNGWHTHETLGALIVCLIFAGLSALIAKVQR